MVRCSACSTSIGNAVTDSGSGRLTDICMVCLTVSWLDVGGYTDVKLRLQQALEWPIKHADAYKRLGLQAPRGILLHGPPGYIFSSSSDTRSADEWLALELLQNSKPCQRGGALRCAGCSKTTLARAAAAASGMLVQVLSGAQLFSMYVGEGEALLRGAFQRARMSAPSIIFIDEIDAVVGKPAP